MIKIEKKLLSAILNDKLKKEEIFKIDLNWFTGTRMTILQELKIYLSDKTNNKGTIEILLFASELDSETSKYMYKIRSIPPPENWRVFASRLETAYYVEVYKKRIEQSKKYLTPKELEKFEESIAEILKISKEKSFSGDSSENILEEILQGEDIIRIPGLIDKVQRGLTLREVSAIGARPGVGKTSSLVNLMKLIAEELPNLPVLIVQVEMSKAQLIKKIIPIESNGTITADDMRKIPDDKRGSVEKIYRDIEAKYKNINIVDNIKSLEQLSIELMVRDYRLVIVDFIQLMEANGYDEADSRYRSIKIYKELKWLSKTLNMHICVFSQLNREIDSRISGTPFLSDFAESSIIEWLAELAIIITKPSDNELYFWALKSRSGSGTGKYSVPFKKSEVAIKFKEAKYCNQ